MGANHRLSQRRPRARHRSRAELVQQRRFVLSVCVLALTVIITAAASQTSSAAVSPQASATADSSITTVSLDPRASLVSKTYTAELRGSTSGEGTEKPSALLTLDYDADLQELTYTLDIRSPIANPTVAAICQGASDQRGSTVYTLFAGPSIAGRFSGVLSAGTMEAGSLVGTLRGGTLADLVLLIERGSAYATIGTSSSPVDAARGQIK